MKYLYRTHLATLLLVIAFASVSNAGNYRFFPTNFDGDSLALAYKDLAHFMNGTWAIAGTIDKIETVTTDGGPKPYISLRLLENNPDTLNIWIASLINLDTSQVQLGDTVRVLGHLSPIDPENNQGEPEFNDQGFHLFSFIVVNLSRRGIYIVPGTEKQLEAWKAGDLDRL